MRTVCVCAKIPIVVCKKVCFHGTESLDNSLLDYIMRDLYVVIGVLGDKVSVFIVDVAGPSEMLVTI